MRRLNVACYYPWVYLQSGIERTIVETVKRSRHKWTIYTNHYSPDNTFADFKNINVRELSRISVKRGYLHVLRGALRILSQRIPINSNDLLMVHCEGLGDLITFRNHTKPVICYCWTPLKVLNDADAYRQYSHLKGVCWELFGLFTSK